jgi:hypothetical protein
VTAPCCVPSTVVCALSCVCLALTVCLGSRTLNCCVLSPLAVNEIQEIKCQADNGTFLLSFRENSTTPIYWNTSVAQFAHQLEQLYT